MGKRKDGKSPRGHNEGTWSQLPNGKWWARITLPDGRRKPFYGNTEAEVKTKMKKALRDLSNDKIALEKAPTLQLFLDTWLEDIVEPTRKPTVTVLYRTIINKHIIPAFGNKPLDKLTPQMLQTFYREKLHAGLSAAYVNRMHDILHVALNDALKWGYVTRNVATLAQPPREEKHPTTPLDGTQAKLLLEMAEGDRLEALYYMALTTAMREGELLGLKWQDIDFDRGILQVKRGMAKLPKVGFVELLPKNQSSIRTILLTDIAINALKRHRTRQLEERLQAGPKWEDRDLVFCNTGGKPIERQNLTQRHLYPLLEKAGLPRVTFHMLRHSAATLLLSLGIPTKVVSEILGHSNISTTADIYQHVLPAMQKEAIERLNHLLK